MGNLQTLTASLSAKLGMTDTVGMMDTLKATAFRGTVSDNQMTALLLVANQYGLNPWTREIYAFPDQNNGIVPVVGVDGWSRIMNDHPQLDGMEFMQDDESCTCIIYRKDRKHPVKVTEYLSECRRDVKPWKTHPKRMLRHKAMIQCARVAFGYAGIFDQDEAERILENDAVQGKRESAPIAPATQDFYGEVEFAKNIPVWAKVIASGHKTPDGVIDVVESIAPLTEKQKETIRKMPRPAEAKVTVIDADGVIHEPSQIKAMLENATTLDALADAATLINSVKDKQQKAELTAIYEARGNQLN